MWLSNSDISDTALIFNHIPKAGGTSLIRFFQDLFGKDRCFRHKTRDPETNRYSDSIRELDDSDLQKYDFFAGHFDYGHHKLFKDRRVKYLGVIRDPIERVISDYYYNRVSGRPDLKKITNELTLEEYIRSKLDNKNSRMARSSQIMYLTGQSDIGHAVEILNQNYFVVCTSNQLNQCQEYLSKIYCRPDLKPVFVNRSSRRKEKPLLSQEIIEEMNKRFYLDNVLFKYVEARFIQCDALGTSPGNL